MLGCKVFRKPESEEAFARRREEILTAAEQCFIRAGFHRTTMQNIAGEAGMSVGNLYRYFAAKDAVVEALVARDQAKLAEDFDSLSTDDPMQAFTALMRRQFEEAARGESVLWLEICAEAARNPAIAAVSSAHRHLIAKYLTGFFTRVAAERARAGLPAATDAPALAELVITLFSGLMITQALASDDRVKAGLERVLALVNAMVNGDMAAPATGPARIEAFA